MEKLMRILFLDVDGPLIPTRIWENGRPVFVRDKLGGYYLWDKDCCESLNSICGVYGAKIVFNSSHNTSGPGILSSTAKANGIRSEFLHDDLCTKYPQLYEERPTAIYDWLERNVTASTRCHWLVIDDFELPVGDHLVNVTLKEGVGSKHVLSIVKKFSDSKSIEYYKE
jgi:hypothetical protein